MKCALVRMPGGGPSAIATFSGNAKVKTCSCGHIAVRMCDWRTGEGKTCDAPICERCGCSPSEGKDLCNRHTVIWDKHPANPAVKAKREAEAAAKDGTA